MSESDTETPLYAVDPFPEYQEPTPCEAQLAQLLPAISTLAARVEEVVTAVNSIGGITETTQQQISDVLNFINSFQEKFAGMSPAEMIKSLLRGGA